MRYLLFVPAALLLAFYGGHRITEPALALTVSSHASTLTAPDTKCGGTGGVSVSPCPLVLSKRNGGLAQFSVTGPGVVTTYVWNFQVSSYCYDRQFAKICYVQNLGSPPTSWQATSGPACGQARRIHFSGYDASGVLVGRAYLEVINRDCP